jgi:hypothetical protein
MRVLRELIDQCPSAVQIVAELLRGLHLAQAAVLPGQPDDKAAFARWLQERADSIP